MKTTKKQIVFCPHCKKDLSKVGIGFGQTGQMLYKVWSDGENLQYDTLEFGDTDGGEFYCQDCGKTLLFTEDEIIKILK